MEGNENPAAVLDNPSAGEEGQAPVAQEGTKAPEQAPVAPAPKPEEAKPATPDISTLLQDPALRDEVLKHPDVVRDIERRLQHRFSSERGRVRAELKAELDQIQQEDAARKERERLRNMDDLELGEEYKKRIQNEDHEAEIRDRLAPREKELEIQLLSKYGQEIFGGVYSLAKEAGATEDELSQIDPMKYDSMGDYLKGSLKFLSSREGKKLAKDMAKVEAQAMLEERNREEREKNPTPEALPAGTPAQSDQSFFADFANANSNDFGRAEKLLKSLGF